MSKFPKNLVLRSKVSKFWFFKVKILVLVNFFQFLGRNMCHIASFNVKISQKFGFEVQICANFVFDRVDPIEVAEHTVSFVLQWRNSCQ